MTPRTLLIPLAAALALLACKPGARKETAPPPLTTVQVIDNTFDFGHLAPGETVGHPFRFKNTGDHPLHLRDIATSCGCATARLPEAPVPPGDTATIEITFDTTGKTGLQYKTIHVFTNTPDKKFELTIKANIKT
jgi:hypothetical protein